MKFQVCYDATCASIGRILVTTKFESRNLLLVTQCIVCHKKNRLWTWITSYEQWKNADQQISWLKKISLLICTYPYLRMGLCYMASKGLNFIFHFSLSMTSWPAKFPGAEWCWVRQTAGVWTEEWETRGGREERRRRERRKSSGNYIQSSRYTGVHLEREGGREGGEREREEGRGRERGREGERKGGRESMGI